MMQLEPIKQSFSVNYSYSLHFTKGLFAVENTLLSDIISGYKSSGKVKLLFVVDSGVADKHSNLLPGIEAYCSFYEDHLSHTKTLLIEGGENSKNNHHNVHSILEEVSNNAICRHSFVVVIGGGAVMDMAGYAAAIAHRGVQLIRIPTTVLSQNDSAVGVKNSINIFEKKNFLGTFAPPYAIINDSDFLLTLEQRDWIAGVAEAIKVALIKDATFFKYIAEHASDLRDRQLEAMQYVIYKCAEMHMQHIAQGGDPFESGSSRPLDFGHWAAHKLEQMTAYSLRHGEAVAKGIALDVTYAAKVGMISSEILDNILNVMEEIGFDLHIPVENDVEIEQLLKGIEEFREHLGGELTITLIDGIGIKKDVHEIDVLLMKEAIGSLNERCKSN